MHVSIYKYIKICNLWQLKFLREQQKIFHNHLVKICPAGIYVL